MSSVEQYFKQKRKEVLSRPLKHYPKPDLKELREVQVFEQLFSVLKTPFIVDYPLIDLRVELNALIGPRLSYLISIGDYERTDLELILKHMKNSDHVLEIGAGAGLTAALSSKLSRYPVVVVDPDKRLEKLVKRQAQLNQGKVKFVQGCVVSMEETKRRLPFYLSNEIWFSSVYRTRKSPQKKITATTIGLNTLLKRFRPSFLVMDIEGAEKELFDCPLAHSPGKILMEIHTPLYGNKTGKKVIQRLKGLGYKKIDELGWTSVFAHKK